MNDELLMDLADCGSPEKLLAVILKHHPTWTAPVPVEELATAVNIVKITELEVDGFEGSLQTDAKKQRGVILYKAGTREERRRFTIAHELGHFLMPSHKGNSCARPWTLGKLAATTSINARKPKRTASLPGCSCPSLGFPVIWIDSVMPT
jgi:IrrE N-terminal-like domain